MHPFWKGPVIRISMGVCAGLCLFANSGFANSSVRFRWLPVPDLISGYRIRYGNASGAYNQVLDAGNTTNAVVSNLVAGATYYFVLTAYNSAGLESDFSNELRYLVPTPLLVSLSLTPAQKKVVTVTGPTNRTYVIEASANLSSWTGIGTVTLGASGSASLTDTSAQNQSKRFYRARAP